MVVKVFISGISASKEVKKHQLRAQFLLDSYKIKYELVDITDPLCESAREKMLDSAKRRNEAVPPQPPQFFNDDEYCGDYEDLENANDNDELFRFLKLEEDITIENGNSEENDLFQSETTTNGIVEEGTTNDSKNLENGEHKDINEEKNEDNNEEDVKMEVREQITVNGVVYDIPPNRKILIGDRLIDVDQLLEDEDDEIDLDDVDDRLKDGLISEKKTNQPKLDEENEEKTKD